MSIAVITKDLISNGHRNYQTLQMPYEGKTHKRFKLYDDDGILYYEGHFDDDDWCYNQEAILMWGMSDAGCTYIEVSENGSPFTQEINP